MRHIFVLIAVSVIGVILIPFWTVGTLLRVASVLFTAPAALLAKVGVSIIDKAKAADRSNCQHTETHRE